MEITENINNWLKNGERGISSEAIVSHLTGINIVKRLGSTDYPKDPADLNRCVKLLEAAPEIRKEMHLMREVCDVWAKLVDSWDYLESLLKEEIAQNDGRCPKTYRAMRELRGN